MVHSQLDHAERGAGVQRAAAAGVQGHGGSLPHETTIQKSFGSHDVGNIQAHIGGAAKDASHAMGAEAYATGSHVAFGQAPSLHTAAHEAAHVVQQRAGVQLAGGVGRAGDAYEQHADRVADAVVQGKSAEGLLDEMAPSAGDREGAAVQRQAAGPTLVQHKLDNGTMGKLGTRAQLDALANHVATAVRSHLETYKKGIPFSGWLVNAQETFYAMNPWQKERFQLGCKRMAEVTQEALYALTTLPSCRWKSSLLQVGNVLEHHAVLLEAKDHEKWVFDPWLHHSANPGAFSLPYKAWASATAHLATFGAPKNEQSGNRVRPSSTTVNG